MPTKTDDRSNVPREMTDRGLPARADRVARPTRTRSLPRKTERGEVRNPLGDFSEQTGAFFG